VLEVKNQDLPDINLRGGRRHISRPLLDALSFLLRIVTVYRRILLPRYARDDFCIIAMALLEYYALSSSFRRCLMQIYVAD